jgi:ketosteroid isomerase-like protein
MPKSSLLTRARKGACICLLPAALATLAVVPISRAAAADVTQATFQRLYDKADAAAAKKDADGVVANYSTSVEATTKDGATKGYTDLLQAAQQAFMLASSVSSHTKIVSCSIKGETAVVVQDGTTKLTVADPNGGPPMVIEDDSRAKDEWKKTDNGWKIVKEAILSDDMKANGKPVQSIIGGSMPSVE